MQNPPVIRRSETRISEVSDRESLSFRGSTAFEFEPQGGQANELKPNESQEVRAHDEVRPDPHDGAHLLGDTYSPHGDKKTKFNRGQFRAFGVLGLCILGPGTFLIAGAVIFLGYFWQTSIRAKDGEVEHSQLWNRIVFSNWASRVVTITAALLRVCLSLHMGVFTAMMASLMIERAGVPLHSAPLISMLRAVSASPYNLLTAFVMPWQNRLIYTVALVASVSLTVGFQFASTALLSDFDAVNITSPRTVAGVSLYGKSFQGSRLWNSQPWTYFRFAEHPRTPPDVEQRLGRYEDTGDILRALLPFEAEASRSRLRRYQGPAAVLNSRVVCVRPNITQSVFSMSDQQFGDTGHSSSDEFFVRGSFGFLDDYDGLPIDKNSGVANTWPFKCVVPTEGTQSGISICALTLYDLSDSYHIYQSMPSLSNTSSPTTIFLMFKSVGSATNWMDTLSDLGNATDQDEVTHTAQWEADAEDWPTSTDGIWSRVNVPDKNYSMSVSACFTVLGGTLLNVSISIDVNGPEPRLSWDNDTAQFNIDIIRKQYWSPGNQAHAMDSRGLLELDSWENDEVNAKIHLSASASRLPFIDKFRSPVRASVLPCGILGAGSIESSRALHYAHSTLFQNVMNITGSLAEALQAVLMVTQQMEYHEYISQSQNMRRLSASYIMAEEKVIPAQWLGFSIVIGMIAVHFLLLVTTTVLFLMCTKASWIGNVWMSLCQVVSPETEGIIQKSTHKDDHEVKNIAKTRSTSGLGLRERVKVRKNETNDRHEIASF